MVGTLLVHEWIMGIHGFTRHRGLDLGEAITFPLILFFVINHGGCIQMSFCLKTPKLGVSKFPKLGLPTLWRAIISCANLWLKWAFKQSYNPCWKLCNNMWHAIYMHLFQGDSWLLVGGSQINTLTFGLSLAIARVFKYSNGSCNPIFYINVSRTFQWYKELFDPMNFDP